MLFKDFFYIVIVLFSSFTARMLFIVFYDTCYIGVLKLCSLCDCYVLCGLF